MQVTCSMLPLVCIRIGPASIPYGVQKVVAKSSFGQPVCLIEAFKSKLICFSMYVPLNSVDEVMLKLTLSFLNSKEQLYT